MSSSEAANEHALLPLKIHWPEAACSLSSLDSSRNHVRLRTLFVILFLRLQRGLLNRENEP